MNILLITQTIPHYRKRIYELLCSNTEFGIDYYLAADEDSNDSTLKVLDQDNLPSGSSLKNRWFVVSNLWIRRKFLWQRKLFATAISRNYDVVVMTGDVHYLSTWAIAAARRLLGRPTLMWTHGLLRRETGLKLFVRKAFYSLSNGLLLYGKRAKLLLIESGFQENKLHVVFNSLDYKEQTANEQKIGSEQVEAMRKDLGIEPDDQVVITTGRLTATKKIHLLIEILPMLNASRGTRLLVVGDGPELPRLKELALRYNVQDKVLFFGSCYDEKTIGLLMKLSDVFVLPGDAGLSVIHGLTYGIPVVTHDDMNTQKPEVEAIEDGVNGSFYKSDDLSDLVSKVHYWLQQAAFDKSGLAGRCKAVIDKCYNPDYQLQVINQAVCRVLENR